MGNTYKLTLKTGDTIVFTTDMTEGEIYSLPPFTNQHAFFKFFQEKELIIHGIIKQSLVSDKDGKE